MSNSGHFKDETGKRYGHLVVLYRAEKRDFQLAYWVCQCDCGSTTVVMGGSLRQGLTKSCGCRTGKGHDANAFHSLCLIWKKSAHRRGYVWSLSDKEVRELAEGLCFYCGKQPSQVYSTRSNTTALLYNGIDRIDNTLGYISGNVVSCCGQCNSAKSDYTQSEFRDWIRRVHNHWVEREVSQC